MKENIGARVQNEAPLEKLANAEYSSDFLAKLRRDEAVAEGRTRFRKRTRILSPVAFIVFLNYVRRRKNANVVKGYTRI